MAADSPVVGDKEVLMGVVQAADVPLMSKLCNEVDMPVVPDSVCAG